MRLFWCFVFLRVFHDVTAVFARLVVIFVAVGVFRGVIENRTIMAQCVGGRTDYAIAGVVTFGREPVERLYLEVLIVVGAGLVGGA